MATATGLIIVLLMSVAVDERRPVNAYADVDTIGDGEPVVALSNGHAVGVWTPQGQTCNPLAATSDDGGVTWSEPVPIKTNIGLDDGYVDNEPSLATDGNGTWIAIWTSTDTLGGLVTSNYDILAARSTDGGRTWSDVQLVSEPTSFYSRAPDLATDGNGTWIAAWSGSGLLYARSTDNGATWEAPVHVIDGLETRWNTIATDGDGTWILVWDSAFDAPLFNNDSDILYVRSLDNGDTWSPIRAVNTDATGTNVSDRQAEIAVDATGTWVVAWERYDSSGGDYDLRFARSTNDGATWSAPAALNSDANEDGFGETDNQVALSVGQDGRWLAAWRAYKGGSSAIHLSHSGDGGATWSPLEVLPGSGADSDPQHVVDATGNRVMVFESSSTLDGTIGGDRDILAVRLRLPFDPTCPGDADSDGYAAAGDAGCPLGGLADCDDTDIAVAPGAVQSCDGLNNDCSHGSWPALAGTNELDDDGDGFSECAGDCNDADAFAWVLPSVVSGVVVGRGGSGTSIGWDPPADPGGDPATVAYDVIRGEAPFACNVVGPQSCLESDDGADRSAEDVLVPAPGSVFFYQVRAENGCPGIGRVGFATYSRLRSTIDCVAPLPD